MKISIIAACSLNRVIGYKNNLPWKLPSDLARFKSLTMGQPVIMGRKTFQSIGKPLPGRLNIVISSRTISDYFKGEPKLGLESGFAIRAGSYKEALSLSKEYLKLNRKVKKEVFIIGGASIYEAALEGWCDCMYLTIVDDFVEGDTYFPNWSVKGWEVREMDYCFAGEKDEYNSIFIKIERKYNYADRISRFLF